MEWVALIPKLIALFSTITNLVMEHKAYGSGWAAATAQALTTANAQITEAADELANAETIHTQDATDGAFLQKYKRAD